MPRKPLIKTSEYPYHIYGRSNNKEWFDLPMEQVWEIFYRNLNYSYEKFNVQSLCFVLMSNHYHLFLRTPDANIDKVMQNFNQRLSLDIRKRSGRINHILGGRYKWSLIKSQNYYQSIYRYIYQNPLRANISNDIQTYKYHSMSQDLVDFPRLKDKEIHIADTKFASHSEKLHWINSIESVDAILQIRKGLKKSVYGPVFSRNY